MRRERAYGSLVSAAMVLAVSWPLVRGEDGFPLSNYPMFSTEKEPRARSYHVVALSSVGRHRPVVPAMLGTEEVMQAHQTVRLAVRAGRERSLELCRDVAGRIRERGDDWADVEHLEVRVDVYDTIAYWQDERRPLRTRVVARCAVGSAAEAR